MDSELSDARSDAASPKPVPVSAQIALIIVIVFIGSAGLWIQFRPTAEGDLTTIEEIALELDGWQGRDIPLSDGVERILQADAQIQRVYTRRVSEVVWLYVGYYGTARGGRPEHTPWVCYPSAGWQIERSMVTPMAIESAPGEDPRINELIVNRDGKRRLVHFWYATHRSTAIASETGLTLDHLAGRLSSAGRADGALVRLSTPIDARGLDPARDRLRTFSRFLVREINQSWPRPVGRGAA